MQNFPLFRWFITHPRLSSWFVLSLGMVGLLAYEARNVGLQSTQWIALIVATVLVAGLCIWIISWEDAEEEANETTSNTPVVPSTNETV